MKKIILIAALLIVSTAIEAHVFSEDFNTEVMDALIVDGRLGTTNEIFQGFGYYVDASSQLQLKPNSNMEKIELYNVLGQQIHAQNLNSTTETINLSGFTSGVYIATVTIEGQTRSFEIVKR